MNFDSFFYKVSISVLKLPRNYKFKRVLLHKANFSF